MSHARDVNVGHLHLWDSWVNENQGEYSGIMLRLRWDVRFLEKSYSSEIGRERGVYTEERPETLRDMSAD